MNPHKTYLQGDLGKWYDDMMIWNDNQHQKLIYNFTKFYNIHWSHKELCNIGWGIWTQFWPKGSGKEEIEQANLSSQVYLPREPMLNLTL